MLPDTLETLQVANLVRPQSFAVAAESSKNSSKMIPLRDENPTSTTPVVTWTLVGINVLVFLNQILNGLGQANLGRFRFAGLMEYAMVPAWVTGARLAPPFVPDPPLTIFTSMFLHGGWMHILGNMVYLVVFGNNIEDRLGHVKFLLFYLGSGFLAAFAHILSDPTSPIPTVGASGAIAGVMGAYIVSYPSARVICAVFLGFFYTTIEVPAIIVLGVWILTQVGSATMQAGTQMGGGVAYLAHIGGFFGGIVLLFLLGGGKGRAASRSHMD